MALISSEVTAKEIRELAFQEDFNVMTERRRRGDLKWTPAEGAGTMPEESWQLHKNGKKQNGGRTKKTS